MKRTALATILVTAAAANAANTAPPTLDDLLGEPDPPAAQPDTTQPAAPENLEDAIQPESVAELFQNALYDMDMAARRLGRQSDTSSKTQTLQQDIIDKLDELIQQAQSSSSSSSQQQQQPAPRPAEQARPVPGQPQPAAGQPQPAATTEPQDPGTTSGTVGPVVDTSKPIEELRREWGNLPPRLRRELSESLSEPFSPSHRNQTEAYFRTLADFENQTTP
ncbi:hypothetical protein [Mucisphaera calidilacus]|uniref:Uncharacterized protein n=1 Tax=Mucisphaera calidilacus TaxID=2527982 RepID=A0A518C0W9_9BACT|nr:hypothetical protein [Mucisphaera calidilacus]QDU72871.1 hypothetical protein Pan265_27470 [Mucisphaera calidilacus]